MTAKSLNASSAATTRKITLNLSENAYQGDAQFSVTVDNIAIGGVLTVAAPHGTGQSQAFALPGTFDLGAHDVAVTFLNDRYDGTPQTDRNLYFDSVLSDAGTQTVGEGMFSTGDLARTTVPAAASSGGLVLSMAKDAYQGDAQFTATVDGTQVGGVQTVTASHTAGKVQAFDLGGNFAKGAHVVAITFLNDAYGGSVQTDRNLYVQTVALGGTAVTVGKELYTSGDTAKVTVTVAGLPSVAPVSALSVLDSIGINIHLGYNSYVGMGDDASNNFAGVEADLAYLGIKHVRDSIAYDYYLPQVDALGAKGSVVQGSGVRAH